MFLVKQIGKFYRKNITNNSKEVITMKNPFNSQKLVKEFDEFRIPTEVLFEVSKSLLLCTPWKQAK